VFNAPVEGDLSKFRQNDGQEGGKFHDKLDIVHECKGQTDRNHCGVES